MRLVHVGNAPLLRRTACTALALACTVGSVVAAGAEAPTAPAPDLPWSTLRFTARKLFLSATATVRAEAVPTASAASSIRRAPQGENAPVPSSWLVRITTSSDLPFGRDEVATVLLDPSSGAAVQAGKEVHGSHPYAKVFRYVSRGFYEWRMAPADDRESRLAPDRWGKRKERLVRSDATSQCQGTITDPYALLYLVSAARLDKKDAALETSIVSDGRLVRLAFHDDGLTYARTDFTESWPGGKAMRSGDVLVRTIRVTGAPVGAGVPADDVDLGFLGMRGELKILLEVGTGVPVELSGRTRNVGNLRVVLDDAVLTRPPAPPGGAPAS